MVGSHSGGIQEFFPGSFLSYNQKNNTVEIQSQTGTALRVYILTDDIIRFRFATEGTFEDDFSYAIDRKFKPEAATFTVEESSTDIAMKTANVHVFVDKTDFTIKITDEKGVVICQDEKGFHWEENYTYGGNIVQMSKVVQPGEHFYGLGDKPMHMNMRGKRIQNWGSDVYGFQKDQDPLYKNIPFYQGLHNNKAYGIFFDNSFKTWFDFASERRSVTSFWAHGGEMNYYFINGPELLDVTRRYTELTGVPDMPPMWALGYHQCKWSYYPEKEVREITSKFRELQIPCDAIYLDIDYMNGFRCFTWDLEKFPDPKGMVSDLKEEGFKTIVIIDPGIKIDKEYSVYQEAIENDFFCRRADGPLAKGKVWPGDCYFPDFTNPKVRKWWAGLFKELIADVGVAGVWNDMNEPALFEVESKTMPDDVRHDYDGHPCSHRKAHNVYGMQMVRATHKGVKKYRRPEGRPFCITRSAYSGTQRYTSAWTGDNIATWEHLWVANVQCQRMAISGWSWVGSDIGGFTEHPSPELFIRWIQLGTFHVFMRTHSSGDHGIQEPWTFGDEATDIVRSFIELRYKLLPYLYTAFYQYIYEKTPILRPISFIDQSDADTIFRADEFMHGDHLLICPILEPNVKGRYMYLPKGMWFNYWTDELTQGGKEQWVDASLETIPIFIRPGAVVPMYPVQQYVGEKEIDTLTLHAYHVDGEAVESVLYEDGGDGYEFREGIYNLKTFVASGSNDFMRVTLKNKGHYNVEYAHYEFVVHGLPFTPTKILVNRVAIDLKGLQQENGTYIIKVEKAFLSIELTK